MTDTHRQDGFGAFLIIWAGQFVSLIGSGLTGFVLGLWVLQRTGSVTEFAIISLCTVLPQVLISPVAGALVDRWDRRRTMMLSDAGAGISTMALVILVATDSLAVWHICVAVSFISLCGAFQMPAYSAATTGLVPRERLGQASGLVQVAQGTAQTVTPALAGVLVGFAGFHVTGIILVDAATYVVALASLALVKVPPPAADADDTERKSILADIRTGWVYLRSRPELMVLLGFLAAFNFLLGMVSLLISPLVLSFASMTVVGTVVTCAGMGMFAGSVLIGIWGGPRQKINGVLGFMFLCGAALLPTGLAQSSTLIAAGGFVFLFGVPIVSGCSQTIMQMKVEPRMQGRVFAFSRMLCAAAMPLAFAIAGPISDRLFEPMMAAGGPLAGILGPVIGVGTGRGIALLFMICGALFVFLGAIGFLYKPLRHIQTGVPVLEIVN
jgi:DHA3 family macrolide efflux protein-like MFS transporter